MSGELENFFAPIIESEMEQDMIPDILAEIVAVNIGQKT